MRSHPADTLVSLGGQRVAEAFPCFDMVRVMELRVPAAEVQLWRDLMEALMECGPRDRRKPLSDRMEVGE